MPLTPEKTDEVDASDACWFAGNLQYVTNLEELTADFRFRAVHDSGLINSCVAALNTA